jgi:hypothetical protein
MWVDDAIFDLSGSYYVADEVFLMRKIRKEANFMLNKICIYGGLKNTKT